jgi:ATP-dependent Lon protease
VKEQMNKRKPDDEFAQIDLSYFNELGDEVVVYCPESKDAAATQHPSRRRLSGAGTHLSNSDAHTTAPLEPGVTPLPAIEPLSRTEVSAGSAETSPPEPAEQHFTIMYGDAGHSYESIIGPYLGGAQSVVVEDPYIRLQHQIQNFVRFCETLLKFGSVKKITLVTSFDDEGRSAEIVEKLDELKQSLLELDVTLDVELNPNIHDREIRLDNGWIIKIGRGLDFYQKPGGWFEVGANDLSLRKCLETKVDIFRS